MFAGPQDGNVKLLGAPLGTGEFCAALGAKLVAKASMLLREISKYRHTQGALML